MIGLLVQYLWTSIKRNYKKGEENGKHLNLLNLRIEENLIEHCLLETNSIQKFSVNYFSNFTNFKLSLF